MVGPSTCSSSTYRHDLTFLIYSVRVIAMRRVLFVGFLIWVAGTVVVRELGQYFLRPGHIGGAVLLYAVSFVAMAILTRAICSWLAVEKSAWLKAAAYLALPTLLLDPFSCLFFARAFPSIDPLSAGIFGGWMLICCAGAILGVAVIP